MHKDTAALRWTLGPLGLIAAVVLAVVSGVMNWRFGFSLGKTETDGLVYAWAAVGADVFKIASPFFFFGALAHRRWAVAVAAALVWVVTTAFALTGAFGHAALNRLDTAGQRTLASTAYKDHRADLKRYQDQLSWLPPHRAAAAVKAEMEALKANRFWSTTAECQTTAGKAAREFCAGYHKLDAELGNALEAGKLNAKIEDVSAKIAGTKGEAVMSDADPQASIIAKVLTWDLGSVQLALAILLVLVLEVGSGLGPYAALNYIFTRSPAAAMPIVTPQAALEADPPRAEALPQAEPLKALPAPETAVVPHFENDGQPEPPKPGKPMSPPMRRPISEAAQEALRGIGFPEVRPVGPVLERQAAALSAERFAVWLKAVGATGRHSITDVTALYQEFCAADHREPCPYNGAKGLAAALDSRRLGVSKTRSVDTGAVEWVVSPMRAKKADRKALGSAPAAEPEEERPTPLAPSKLAEFQADRAALEADKQADNAGKEARRILPFGAPVGRVVPMRPDGQDLAWLRFQEKAHRAARMALNRKQRGSRRVA